MSIHIRHHDHYPMCGAPKSGLYFPPDVFQGVTLQDAREDHPSLCSDCLEVHYGVTLDTPLKAVVRELGAVAVAPKVQGDFSHSWL